MKNESSQDRIIRAILGAVLLLIAYLWLSGVWAVIFNIVGIISLFTAATGFCLLYKLFGIDTNKSDKPDQGISRQ